MSYQPFIYQPSSKEGLTGHDPDFTGDFSNEEEAKGQLQEDCADLAKYQDILMAHEKHGLLIIFQGMDGAGKDAAIKHVMSHADPQGCQVKMFKEPSTEELRHDYLWTARQAIPARGGISIFNRSYYEHVITDRVHRKKLDAQNLPADVTKNEIWVKRYHQINNFEQYLIENGIKILKFFLHISRETQRQKLLERIARPDKRWKFSITDLEDRQLWDKYMKTYGEVFENTSTRIAPWHIIPANNRWFARATIASLVAAQLKSLHSNYSSPNKKLKEMLAQAEKDLKQEAT